MKLSELLERLRLRSVENEDESTTDEVDLLEADAFAGRVGWSVGHPRSSNWLPSQQDERPHH